MDSISDCLLVTNEGNEIIQDEHSNVLVQSKGKQYKQTYVIICNSNMCIIHNGRYVYFVAVVLVRNMFGFKCSVAIVIVCKIFEILE